MTGELERLYAQERERLKNIAEDKRTGERLRPVFGDGPENALLMLIGEAPGAAETEQGRPFVGKAGAQLVELLELAGIPRESVFVTNAVKYRPTNVKVRSVSNRTPSQEEILESLPLLGAEIGVVRPRSIATLGNTPLYAVNRLFGGADATVGELHGRAIKLDTGADTLLFPLYHPASGIYRRELVAVMKEDILKLKAILGSLERGDML